MKKLLALVPAVLLACADGPTSPAPAAEPALLATGGAVVVHDKVEDSRCFQGMYYTSCYTIDGQMHRTETPSGNAIFFWHADYTSDYKSTYPGFQYESSSESSAKNHWVIKQGEPQVMSWKNDGEYTYTLNGQTVTCTYSYRFHYANGEVRIEDYQADCSDPT